jgi:hypothetical protein
MRPLSSLELSFFAGTIQLTFVLSTVLQSDCVFEVSQLSVVSNWNRWMKLQQRTI